MKINHAAMKGLMESANKSGLAMMFKGAPGIGKSDVVRNVAKSRAEAMGRRFVEWNHLTLVEKEALTEGAGIESAFILVDFRAGGMEIGDVKVPVQSTKHWVTWKTLDAIVALSHKDSAGILFLDEFNQASRAVLGSMYQLVLDHGVGSVKLSDGVQIVAAGNRREDKGSTTELQPALVNRMSVYELDTPNIEAWVDWATASGVRADVCGYLLQHPGDLHLPHGKAPPPDLPFPTPRSWTFLSRQLDAATCGGTEMSRDATAEEALVYAAGWVGDDIANQFSAFVAHSKSLNIDAILARPELFADVGRVENGELDMSLRWAAVCGIADRVRCGESSAQAKAGKVWHKALMVVPHIRESELAAELGRFVKGILGSQAFGKRVLAMAKGTPWTDEVDSVPAEIRKEFIAKKALLRFSNLLLAAEDCR